MIAIDTIAVENVIDDNMYQRSELDWLIYHKPLEYAQLVIECDCLMIECAKAYIFDFVEAYQIINIISIKVCGNFIIADKNRIEVLTI